MIDLAKEDTPTSPAHYKLFPKLTGRKASEIQAIDVIQAVLTEEEFRGYLKGNQIKYLLRHNSKNGEEDLNKAFVYMRMYNEVSSIHVQEQTRSNTL